MPGLNFDITADHSNFIRRLDEVERKMNQVTQALQARGTSIDRVFSDISKSASSTGHDIQQEIQQGADGAMNAINSLMAKLRNPIQATIAIAGLSQLGELVGSIAQVRGEFQQMESQINTLIGEKMGNKLMAQLTEFAKVSPLGFKDTVNQAQLMLGFGIDAEKVPRYLSAIGDVAMGDQQRFQSLALAFSQMSAAGKLMGQDLMQMVNAGFQPLAVIAEKTHKSIGELKEEMSAGKISAEMVQQAFIDATSEGGKYYQMSETASKTIPGQVSMLEDAMDLMFNEIGQGSQEVIISVISGATAIVENWETVAEIFGTVAATYGIWKATSIAADIAAKTSAEERSAAIIAAYQAELDKLRELNNEKQAPEPQAQKGFDSDIQKSFDDGSISSETAEELQKQRDLIEEKKVLSEQALDIAKQELEEAEKNVAEAEKNKQAADEYLAAWNNANGEELAQAQNITAEHQHKVDELNKAIEAQEGYIDLLRQGGEEVPETELDYLEELRSAREDAIEQLEAHREATDLDALSTAAQEAADRAAAAQEALDTAETQRNTAATNVAAATEARDTAAQNANTASQLRNTAAETANTTAVKQNIVQRALATAKTGLYSAATSVATFTTRAWKQAVDSLNNAIRNNPLGLFLSLITMTISAIISLISSQDELEETTEKYREEVVKSRREVEQLYAILQSADKQSQTYREAEKKLIQSAKDYGLEIKNEADAYNELIAKKEQLIALIIEEGNQRIYAARIDAQQEKINSAEDDVLEEIEDFIDYYHYDSAVKDENKNLATLIFGDYKANKEEIERLQELMRDATSLEELENYRNQIIEIMESSALKYLDSLGIDGKGNIEHALGRMMFGDIDGKMIRDELDEYEKQINILKQFTNALNQSREATDENVDHVEKSISELTNDELFQKFSNISITPSVDTSQIDAAKEAADDAEDSLETLDNTSATPEVDSTSIQAADRASGSLLSSLQKIAKFARNIISPSSDEANPTWDDFTAELRQRINAATMDTDFDSLYNQLKKAIAERPQGSAERRQLEKLLEEAQKRDSRKKQSGKSAAQLDAERTEKENKLDEANRKHQIQLQRQEEDDARAHEQMLINIERDGVVRRQRQLDLNLRNEALQRQRAREDAIEAEKKRQEQLFNQQEAINAVGQKNYTKRLFSDADIDQSQIDAINERFDRLDADAQRQQQELIANNARAELQAMQELLAEYGTFQQKKYAIAQEYAEKIANAEDEWTRRTLELERDKKISNLEADAINQRIDWAQVFSGFGGMFTQMMQSTLVDIDAYIQSDKFKSLDPADKKAIIEGRDNLAAQIGEQGNATLDFGRLAREVDAYQQKLQLLNSATEQHQSDLDALQIATENYKKALDNGTEEQQQQAKEALDIATQNAEASAKNIEAAQAEATEAARTASKTAQNINSTMTAVTDGLQKLTSGSLRGAYDGIVTMGQKLGGVMGKVADSLKNVPIVGWVLSIIDIFKDGLSNLVGGLIDGILNAVAGIVSDILSGDLFVTIFNSIKNGIGSILNGLSFGGFDSLMSAINGSNAKEVADTTERLTKRNELLTAAIDSLKAEMEKARGLESVRNAEEAREKQAEYISNSGEILAAQMGYHAAHHSNDYYIDQAMSSEDWAEIGRILNRNITSAAELWQLSPEDLRKLQQSPLIWDKIANSGEYDKSEYLDNYLALADSIEDITQALNETLTQISFDGMYDSFVSSLMDMDKSASDFSDDVSKYFMQAMLSNKIGELYSQRLEAWYDDFAEKMKDDGTLSPQEIAALQAKYDAIVADAIADRDAIAAATGYDTSSYSQDATRGDWQSMTEETGQELNGRFTAVQIAAESMAANMIATIQAVNALTDANTLNSSYLESILNQNVIANSHLETIAESSSSLAAIRSELKKMNDKLTNI